MVEYLLTTIFFFLCLVGVIYISSAVVGGVSGSLPMWSTVGKLVVSSAAFAGALMLASSLWSF